MMNVQSHVQSATSVPKDVELPPPESLLGPAPEAEKAAVINETADAPVASLAPASPFELASAAGRSTATAVTGPAVVPSRTQRGSAPQRMKVLAKEVK